MTTTALRPPCAKLSQMGFAPCSCRLGSCITSRDEARQMIENDLAAPMSITNAKGQTGFYFLSVIRLRNRQIVGYCLTSDDEAGVQYQIPSDFGRCECPDHLVRGRRCKHLLALASLKRRNLIP